MERLPCCGKFVHIECQIRWEISSQHVKCGHCRQNCIEFQVRYPQIAQRVTRENEARRARQPQSALTDRPYSPPQNNMSREEIIQRLRALLQTDDLEANLQAVIIQLSFI